MLFLKKEAHGQDIAVIHLVTIQKSKTVFKFVTETERNLTFGKKIACVCTLLFLQAKVS